MKEALEKEEDKVERAQKKREKSEDKFGVKKKDLEYH